MDPKQSFFVIIVLESLSSKLECYQILANRMLIPARDCQFHALDFQFHTLECLFRLATANSTLSFRCCQLICLDLPKPRKTYTNCLSILCLAYLSLQALGFHYKNCKKTLFGVHAQVSYYIKLYYIILYYTILCYAMLCYAILYHTIPYYIIV